MRPLVIAAALLVAFLPAAFGRGNREQTGAALTGTVIDPPYAALDFRLTDQHGAQFHMADTKGKVVVLTFIYTHCGDTCPFVALKVREAMVLLGNDAEAVDFVAVTTDPQRDTPAVTASYSRAVGLFDAWHFVTGDPAAVSKVWSEYGVGVERQDATSKAEAGPDDAAPDDAARGLSSGDAVLAGRIITAFSGGYEVAHTVPFLLIDRRGSVRVLLDAGATPAEIAADVRALEREREKDHEATTR